MGFGGWKKRAWHIREWYGTAYAFLHPLRTGRFLFGSREITNFTYDIRNEHELSEFLSAALGRPAAQLLSYIEELRSDRELQSWLGPALAQRADRDAPARYGRRLGWYAIARAIRPRVIIETGTHDGLGTSIFARAQQRNAAEGHPGRVWTFDHEPGTGWLVPDPLRPMVDFVAGDIEETLPRRLQGIRPGDLGLFLHDSRHSYEHERFEFDTAFPWLSHDGALVTDNSQNARALQDVARQHHGRFAYWKEVPKRHPYPGSGIGIAAFGARATSNR